MISSKLKALECSIFGKFKWEGKMVSRLKSFKLKIRFRLTLPKGFSKRFLNFFAFTEEHLFV